MFADSPSIIRRIASLIYDALLLIAIFMLSAALFIALFGEATHAPMRYCLQLFLWGVAALYFTYNWQRGGTLAMQTWRIKLVSRGQQALTYKQTFIRYALASGLFGLTFLWALFDKEGLYLHDRIAGTRLQLTDKQAKPSS